jgi:cell division protein FtsL
MRLLSLLAFGFLAGLVILIYEMKFETRRLENRAAQLQRAIEDEKDNVALMRAEWSHVTRPERVEKLAREVLDLAPVKSAQIVDEKDFMATLAQRPQVVAHPEVRQARDEIGALIRNSIGGGTSVPHTGAQ